MAIKIIKYKIDVEGISPSTEQVAGTQGEHNATKLNINVTDVLYNAVERLGYSSVMCRFDVHDCQGSIWQSQPQALQQELNFSLQERHTRFGGKVRVYFVITALSDDNRTEMELYSYPMMLRFNNRPEGTYANSEDYQSLTGLVEMTKLNAEVTKSHMSESQKYMEIASSAAEYANKSADAAHETLKNINSALEIKQDKLIAGDGISISKNNVISLVGAKVDLSNYYTKTEIEDKMFLLNDMNDDIGILYDMVGNVETLLGGI